MVLVSINHTKSHLERFWQLLILINLQEFSWDSRGDKNGLENHLKKSGKIFPPKFFESVKMVKWTLEIDSWGLDQVEATSGWRWLQHILISIFPLCVMPLSMKSVKKREPFWKHIQHCFWIKITMMDLRLWIWLLWLGIKRFWSYWFIIDMMTIQVKIEKFYWFSILNKFKQVCLIF